MEPSDDPTLAADSDATLLPDGSAPSGRTAGDGESALPGPGAMIGRFRLVRLLGRGGMGAVFLADDPQLGRQVAIKLVATGESAMMDSVAAARLTREAQSMARVTHPNLVHVYDVGTVADRVWIAMEYVPGRTLRQWLEDHRGAEWSVLLEPFVAAGRGIAAAHRANLVHRDFKPDNVIVGDDGIVRVLDFGLARDVGASRRGEPDPLHLDSAPPDSSSQIALDVGLTRTGALVGTPAYMSPEQLRGEATDVRTDIFSFSVALFEAVHGRRPFKAESYPQLLDVVLGNSAIEAPAGRVPGWLNVALLRGLERDRTERWASMDELLAELDRASGTPRRRPLVLLLAILGITVLTAMVGFAVLTLVGIATVSTGPNDEGQAVALPEPTPAEMPIDDGAAKKALAMVLIAPNGAERLNRAKQYIEDHGDSGGQGRLALAEATAAMEVWQSSCPSARMGLCLAMTDGDGSKPKPESSGCLSPGLPAIEVVERSRDESDEAQRLAADAIGHALAGGAPDPGDAIVQEAWATLLPAAKAIHADSQLETYFGILPSPALARHGPSKLGKTKSGGVDALTDFFDKKRDMLAGVVAEYDTLIAESTGFARVVALSRRAIARQSLYDAVARMPIPSEVAGGELQDGYCDILTESVRPYADSAVADFRACVDEAMTARLSSEYVSFCEAQIEDIEKLDRNRIRETIRANIHDVVRCYETGLQADPSLTGQVLVRFTIGKTGTVSDSMLVGDPPFPDPTVATCIETVVKGLEFPAPTGDSITVSYPFNLTPGDG